MQASKWLKSAALLSPEEMAKLIEALHPAKLFVTGSVVKTGEGELPPSRFLEVYCDYINALRSAVKPKATELQPYFSCSISCENNSFQELHPTEGKQLLRVIRPVIQMQHHTMDYSPSDQKFHSMSLGTQTIDWGIQFSYPQIFQDPETQQIITIDTTYPNAELFRSLQRWMRAQTIPTPFIVQGVMINAPIRIGKECLDWIQYHPDLARKGITVDTRRNHSHRN